MTRAIGSNAVVKFCQESTWGTTPAAPAVYGINVRNETLGMTKNTFMSETINQYRSVVGLTDGNKAVAGNIITDLLPEGLEVLFLQLLGKPSTGSAVTTTGSGPYVHTLKGQSGYFEGLSIEKGFVNVAQYLLYKGCRINTCTIDIVQEGFTGVTFDFLGKEETDDTSTQIDEDHVTVYSTKDGYNGYQCVLEAELTAGVFTSIGNVTRGTITITNNIEANAYVLGSALRADASFGRRECSGNFEIFFEDLSLYNYFTAGTEIGIRFTFTSGTDSMRFYFPAVKLGGESPKISAAGGINLPLTFQAKRDTTESTDVILTITNSLATIAEV